MRKALDGHTKGEAPTVEEIEAALGEISKGGKAQFGGDLTVAGGAAGKCPSNAERGAFFTDWYTDRSSVIYLPIP